jgi:hypothetical protein
MAIAFFFNDVTLVRQHPDDTVTIRAFTERLKDDQFNISQRTDYVELRAQMHFLNLAVDNGSHTSTDDQEDDDSFNKELDQLTRRLKIIWANINDTGASYMSRTEAKSVIEWVQERLSYTVRTRPREKQGIFDDPAEKEDLFLPKQQEYMKNFLQRK